MTRTLMQVYVKGSAKAVELYQEAFGCPIVSSYLTADGQGYYHCELNVYGQILAVSEGGAEAVTGSTMQFCLHFSPEEGEAVERAYRALTPGGEILVPLGPCDYSSSMADFIDPFGVRWCIFTD